MITFIRTSSGQTQEMVHAAAFGISLGAVAAVGVLPFATDPAVYTNARLPWGVENIDQFVQLMLTAFVLFLMGVAIKAAVELAQSFGKLPLVVVVSRRGRTLVGGPLGILVGRHATLGHEPKLKVVVRTISLLRPLGTNVASWDVSTGAGTFKLHTVIEPNETVMAELQDALRTHAPAAPSGLPPLPWS